MNDFEERAISGLTVRIERDRCAATQNCIKVAPEVFELGDDQIVTFRSDARDIERDRLIEACVVCPTDVFRVLDESGRQIVPG